MMLARYSPTGDLVWATSFPGPGYDRLSAPSRPEAAASSVGASEPSPALIPARYDADRSTSNAPW